ncbi:MAG: flagellar protein [Firmicutes bacterium]|nr:flagellar protein [Bacillota bacterium]HXL04561.1 TIGR02530 family flagellar biosynthesis protein [Bacillota bacterium]
MVDGIVFQKPPVGPVKPARPVGRESAPAPRVIEGKDFSEVLRREIDKGEIRFSGHAEMRMRMRNISLSQEEMAKLNDAVDRAEAKGARESLILMDKLAFIVSIKNRTVITAVDEERMKENVFTNIDSAVIV